MEIDINIEGYNVNGICIGCLNYNRKMYYDDRVREVFQNIAKIEIPVELSIQLCWECTAAVNSIFRFKEQLIKSYNVLASYSKKHAFFNSPEDFTIHSTTRLCYGDVRTLTIDYIQEQPAPKEIDLHIKDEKELLDIKYEEPFMDLDQIEEPKEESEFFDAEFEHNIIQDGVESDEDIQLSQLKKKKDKVKKKKNKKTKNAERKCNEDIQLSHLKKKDTDGKKNSKKTEIKEYKKTDINGRKLKNLPPDIVDLVTMSEEEMLQIRAKDLCSDEFNKIKYKCSDCIIKFNTEKLMEYHMNGKHQPKADSTFQCDICKAYFLTKENVSTHRSLHLQAYKCKQCSFMTTLKKLMKLHDCASCFEQKFECESCKKIFDSRSKLTYHRNVCHQEKPQCDCCGKVFANKMTLKCHLKVTPQKDDKIKEKLYIPCKGCNKVFNSKKSYRAHVVIHNGITYPCPICGKLFQWKRNLSRHTRAHRERAAGDTHECRACRKRFASRDCLNNHLRLSKKHATEDTYTHECNYCGKKFPTKWCMVDHIDWDHLKRIKYQCSVCLKAFKTAKIMVAHMNNIHEGKKKEEAAEGEHLCEICGKSYKTVKRLKGHVWAMHTQRSTTKSYKCKLCSATFTWQTSIYKHMKMMHDSKRIKQPRIAAVKKQEPYPGMDPAFKMEYFHHNLQSIAQSVPVGTGHSMI